MSGNQGVDATLPRTESGARDDKAIRALLADTLHKVCRLDPRDCDLQVREHIAYIHGSVANLAQKRAVAKAAQTVPGLRAVVNDLRIAPLSPRGDKGIAAQVQAALAAAGVLPSLLQVKVVDGVVYLSGALASLEDQFAAEEAAWSGRGVEYVVNNTGVEPPYPRTDEDILRDIQLTLGRCLGPEAGGMQAEVREGVVHLRGGVESQYRRLLIEDTLRWAPYVKDVVNELQVISSPAN